MTNAIVLTVFRQLLSLLLQIVIVILTAKWLVPSDFGELGLLMTYTLFVSIIAIFGLNSSILYYLSKGDISLNDTFKCIDIFFYLTILFVLLVGVILFFIGFEHSKLLLAVITGFSSSYVLLLMSVLQAKERFSSLNIVILIQPIVFLSLLCITFLNGEGDVLLWEVEIAFFLSYFSSMLISNLYVKKSLSIRSVPFYIHEIKKSALIIKQIFNYGAYSCVTNIITIINYRFQFLAVSMYIGGEVAGQYNLAFQLIDKMGVISSSFVLVLLPVLTKQAKAIRMKNTIKYSRVIFLITSIITGVIYLVGGELVVYVFGAVYTEAFNIVKWLLPSFCFLSVIRILSGHFSASGKQHVNFWISLIFLVVNIMLCLLLMPQFEGYGAAMSYSISTFVVMIVYCHKIYKEH
ncbi:polysaccharide biosynthesis C-terminal domain-containing protein [Shewanella gelidimarina]|uniref:oligosaccharide flippase family protein n=1 Tax=Shewanella gelidimarina TaxID=56813 RepID=UPI00200C2E91|nr:polysaccharide biosynthesis C-terminal domain-containing protein [Shewanella gelidimarina]MCL1057879.1 polysaccharide biosynthesis C-terminal domain-containing protein [Shewanella gelidimarina]